MPTDLSQATILAWFAGYINDPFVVYAAIIALMFLSSFGLPVPEEVVLISAGLVSYLSLRTDLHPLIEGGSRVSPLVTACVAFAAVFVSDLLVFFIGRRAGPAVLEHRFVARVLQAEAQTRIRGWTERYGAWASGIFRFTPGLRFPGHLSCGAMGLAPWKFVLVDGLAALFSVPSQVLVVAYFGETILAGLKQFKISLLVVILIAVAVLFAQKYIRLLRR